FAAFAGSSATNGPRHSTWYLVPFAGRRNRNRSRSLWIRNALPVASRTLYTAESLQSWRTTWPWLLATPAIRLGAWMASKRSRTCIELSSEPQPATNTADAASAGKSGLAKPIDTRKMLSEQTDQERGRQSDDVQVVAFDPFH